VPDYGWKVPERRSVQIKHRKAQNYEIMLLDETKKHFGMPAAPTISRISEEETNRDLALMRQRVSPYEINVVDDKGFYSQQSSQNTSQYIPTGFQDRYYPMTAPPTITPQPLAPSHPTGPPPSPPAHPTSINSLLSHDTPPPSSRAQHHHHGHHHHHHHHHHSAPVRPLSGSEFHNPQRLPPLPGARMNHLVDPGDRDRDRVKMEPRREGYYSAGKGTEYGV